MKVLVIGLDGATFDLLSPLLKENMLPTLKKIIDNGVSAKLISTIPPDSGTAWPALLTGRNAGKSGIFNFARKEGYGVTPVKPSYPEGMALWDILSDRSMVVGFINVPLTYPPKKVNGFMVTGFPTPEDAVYTFPATIQSELETRCNGYIIDVNKEGNEEQVFNHLFLAAEKRTQATLYLMERYNWDFVMTVFTGPDRIQHDFWKYLEQSIPLSKNEKAHHYRLRVFQYFSKIDKCIKKMCEGVPQDTNVIIVSDHGMGALKNYININNWLISRKYMVLKSKTSTRIKNKLYAIGINPKNAYLMLRKLHLSFLRKKIAEKGLLSKAADKIFLSVEDVDWSNTKAFYAGLIGWGEIFVNLKGREEKGIVYQGSEYEKLRKDLTEDILKMEDPETGRRVVKKVYRREEIYDEHFIDQIPDLIFEPADGYSCFWAHHFVSNSTVEDSFGISADHKKNGIFIAYGPDITRGKTIDSLSIFDIAPTVLHMFNLEVPEDMDGRVAKEIFSPSSEIFQNEVKRVKVQITSQEATYWTEQEKRDIEEKLRALGYLG